MSPLVLDVAKFSLIRRILVLAYRQSSSLVLKSDDVGGSSYIINISGSIYCVIIGPKQGRNIVRILILNYFSFPRCSVF